MKQIHHHVENREPWDVHLFQRKTGIGSRGAVSNHDMMYSTTQSKNWKRTLTERVAVDTAAGERISTDTLVGERVSADALAGERVGVERMRVGAAV